MSIADEQITRDIEGRTQVAVHFTDQPVDYVALYEQDGTTWVQPAFCKAKRLSKDAYDALVAQFTGEQEFNTDPEVIRSGMTYDDFYNRYYNHL